MADSATRSRFSPSSIRSQMQRATDTEPTAKRRKLRAGCGTPGLG